MERISYTGFMKTLINPLESSLGIVTETYKYLRRSENPEEVLENLKGGWAQSILEKIKLQVEVVGRPTSQSSILFVGNHMSYIDIPLLMNTIGNVSFVAKHEIASWPIFGKAAEKMETVFVKRENTNSRLLAREAVTQALHEGKRVVVFPSGTTSLNESKMWKKGAFYIAKEVGVQVQPFRISYSPARAIAYIDQDFFPAHLYNLFKFKNLSAKIEFHEPVYVSDVSENCIYWYYWSRGLL